MSAAVYLLLFAIGLFALYLLYSAGCLRSWRGTAVSVLLLAIALGLRAYVFPYETLDYQNFLARWVEYFRSHGHFLALRDSIGNYNIPYLYFLALFSLSDIYDLYLIKLLSTFFDVVLAWASMKLASRFVKSAAAQLACFFTVLFLPTVFLNGALWGQCDSTYSAMIVLALYLAIDGKPVRSMICAAVAFGFKLQAVFVLPVFAVLWFYGKFSWKHFLIFPAAYVALVLPAVLLGRPFLDTVTLYLSQTGSIGSALNYNSSSVFAFFRGVTDTTLASNIGIAAAFAFSAVLLLVCLVCRRRLSDRAVLASALLFAVGIPFLLPHMHDRYFFCADVLSVVLAFSSIKYVLAAPLTQFASLLGYYAYLKMCFLLPMRCGSAALIVVLALGLTAFLSALVYPSMSGGESDRNGKIMLDKS